MDFAIRIHNHNDRLDPRSARCWIPKMRPTSSTCRARVSFRLSIAGGGPCEFVFNSVFKKRRLAARIGKPVHFIVHRSDGSQYAEKIKTGWAPSSMMPDLVPMS